MVLFDQSVQSDQKLLFHFQKFLFPVLLQLVTTNSGQNGGWFSAPKLIISDEFNERGVCKLQKQDLNFLLMHSCTQGSGTAEHLDLFFLLVFLSF